MKRESKLEKDYKLKVAQAAVKKTDEVFSNSSLEHAFFLSQKLILNAENKINIVTRQFNSDFYQNLFPELSSFLKKDTKNVLNIAIMEKNNNKIINDLSKNFLNQVKIYWLDKEHSSALINKDKSVYINFLVNDTNGFRYEYQDENIENGIVSAFANFNDSGSAKTLNNFFHRLIAV